MDNFKYSLKTNQFNKKRQHIFPKQVQKQSISLEVHEPRHSVQDLLDFNKSQDNYGLMEQFGNQITKQSIQKQQQSKNLKFNRSKQSIRKVSSTGISQKGRNVCHSISASAKIKIPQINPELSRQKVAQSQATTQELQALKYILYRNEQNLKNLTDSMNSLYRSTIELYNNHERKMRQIVNNRCYEVVRIYKLAVMEIKQKQRNVDEMDSKITILLNTLKNNIDILRITKIKQECIEALQQNQLQQKQKQLQAASRISQSKQNHGNGSFLKISIPEYVDRESKNKIHSAKQTIPVHTFRKQNQKQYFTLRSNNQFQDSLTIDPNCQSINESYFPDYYGPPTPKTSIQLLQHKKSPFQANELLLISSTTPVHAEQNFVQVSFRKFVPHSEKYEIVETDKKPRYGLDSSNVEQYRCRSMTQSMKISQSRNNFYSKKDQYDNLKDKIRKLLKQMNIKQVWMDNLNCLRRKNGTYILDNEGNAVICSAEKYQRLISDQIIVQPNF